MVIAMPKISERVANLPECPESRRACTAYSGGHFRCLSDTYFIKQRKKPCPFYKTKAMVAAQLSDRKETKHG